MGNFGWYVSSGFAAYAHLAGVKLDEAYLDASVCARAFKVGRKRMSELFGPEVMLDSPHCPPISYGHIACLGSPLFFPEDSEPGVQPIYGTIHEGIAALKRPVDFSRQEWFRRYWDTHQFLTKAMDGESFGFGGFGGEGPLTTAVLLRGQDFYMDLMDSPQEAKEFLRLVTCSAIDFARFTRELNHRPAMDPEGTGIADDFASLIAPDLWPEFVIPFWDQYYRGLTTGKRSVHVENLKEDHLPYLKNVGIHSYDPSVSPCLNPGMIRALDFVFGWRLASFDLVRMSMEEVEEWMYRSREEGADVLYTIIEPNMCRDREVEKVKLFIRTCQAIEAGRADLKIVRV